MDLFEKPQTVFSEIVDINPILSKFNQSSVANDWFIPGDGKKFIMRVNGLPLVWRGQSPRGPLPTRARQRHLKAKRVFDLMIAALAVLVLSPLLLIVALLIKMTSPGPVLFKQAREGLDGTTFQALKFRSMRAEQGDASGVKQTIKGDPRITAIGRFIRRTSIDELPQLFNVLGGTMSIVGPRPHVAGMLAGGVDYRALVPYYADRLVMRPGITGWAQANGLRGSTDDAVVSIARIDHDLAYVQNFSIWLDFKIMLLTVQREFLTGSGH